MVMPSWTLPLIALIACFSSSQQAVAQTYPTRPIRLIVPFPAGGGADNIARPLAQKLSEGLGAQVIVDNRSGAGGMIGASLAAKAAGDGYTLLVSTGATHVTAPQLYSRV